MPVRLLEAYARISVSRLELKKRAAIEHPKTNSREKHSSCCLVRFVLCFLACSYCISKRVSFLKKQSEALGQFSSLNGRETCRG